MRIMSDMAAQVNPYDSRTGSRVCRSQIARASLSASDGSVRPRLPAAARRAHTLPRGAHVRCPHAHARRGRTARGRRHIERRADRGGALAERGWDRRFVSMLAAMALGSTVILASGLVMLSSFVPAAKLLAAGLLPFVPGDLVKSALAALAFPAAWRIARRARGQT